MNLNELDFNNIGSWPNPAKAVAVGVLCIAVLGAGYWFDTKSQWETLTQSRQQEQELKQTFEAKQRKAANLDAYQQQMAEMKQSFGAMLRQLPSQTEVEGLLVDISQTGLASGLEFELFKPEAEIPRDFYAELPIRIKVTGSYHQFGNFISGIAALPRIVTLHDISITQAPQKETGKKGTGPSAPLVMEITAKTYRYLEETKKPAGTGQPAGSKT
ncbi:MAG: pilus assembly protein PilO [Gammaproteobacteria bacterium]|nr:MAG: pilus assembly protein PilO [Gammaproteobacteria bacterium]